MHEEGTKASVMDATSRQLNKRGLAEAIDINIGKLSEQLALPEGHRDNAEIESLQKAIATAEAQLQKIEEGGSKTGRESLLADALDSVGQTVSEWDRIREQGGPDAAPMRSMIEEFLAKQTDKEGGDAAATRLQELLDQAKAQREAAKAESEKPKAGGGVKNSKSALAGNDLLPGGDGAAVGTNVAQSVTTFSARGAAAMGYGMQTAAPQEQVVAELKNLAKQQAASGEVEKAQLREIEAIRAGFVLA